MAEKFDPYHKWLGIPPAEQPPHHYRLLGVVLFEDDLDVIASASDRQMAHLRTYQSSQHTAESQRLLNDVAAARLCLLHTQHKRAYDDKLRAAIKPAEPPVAAPAPAAVAPVERMRMPPRAASGPAAPTARATPVKVGSQAPWPRWVKPAIAGVVVVLIWTIVVARWFWGVDEVERRTAPAPRPVANNPPIANEPSIAPPKEPVVARPQTQPAPAPKIVVPKVADGPQPKLNFLASGEEFDLMQIIDARRDSLYNNWTSVNGALKSVDWGGHLSLPPPPSENYSLSMVAEGYTPIGGGLRIGLVAGGRPFSVEIETERKRPYLTYSGLARLDGALVASNATRRQGTVFTGVPIRITCTVRGNWITVVADGHRLVDWTGDLNRLTPNDQDEDPTRLFISPTTTFLVSEIKIKRLPDSAGPMDAIAPAARSLQPGQQVDVLPLIDFERDVIDGRWALQSGTLVAASSGAKFYVPTAPTRNYVLTAEVVRPKVGSSPFQAVLPIGDKSVRVSLGANVGVVVNDYPFSLPRVEGPVLPAGQRQVVKFTVQEERIQITVDDKPIVDWKVEQPRGQSVFVDPLPRNRLRIYVVSGTRIERLTFLPLPDPA